MSPLEILGQILGIVVVILGFVCFQMKTPKGILIFQIIIALVFALHYICIGAIEAAPVNIIAAIQSLCYYFRNKKGSKSLFMPIFFAVLMIVVNLLSWILAKGDWYTAFLMAGITVMAISLSFSSAQNIRYAMLVKAPLCLVYNLFAFSIGGVVYESAVLVSSILGVLKYQKELKNGKI